MYLLTGVTLMMMTLSLFYSIPEFDISGLFLLSCGSGTNGGANGSTATTVPRHAQAPVDAGRSGGPDPERIRLQTAGSAGPKYTQQLDEGGGSSNALSTRRVIRARSRPDDDTPEDEVPGPSSRFN